MPEPDLRELLVAEAVRQRPAAAPPYAWLAGRAGARRRSRAATLAVVAASVAAAAIALPAVLGGPRGGVPSTTTGVPASSASGSPGRSADALGSTFTGEGITFRYPSAWRSQPYQVVSSFSGLITYLSPDRLHNPCSTHSSNTGTEVDCGWPVAHLGPHGVLVTWEIYGMPGARLTAPNTTVGGHPATVHSGAADAACATLGGQATVDAQIAQAPTLAPSGGNDNLIRMSACISGPGAAQAEIDVFAILDSLRFTR